MAASGQCHSAGQQACCRHCCLLDRFCEQLHRQTDRRAAITAMRRHAADTASKATMSRVRHLAVRHSLPSVIHPPTMQRASHQQHTSIADSTKPKTCSLMTISISPVRPLLVTMQPQPIDLQCTCSLLLFIVTDCSAGWFITAQA